MEIWVIYDRPKDYPIYFVLRRWFVGSDGQQRPEGRALLANTLDEARAYVPYGLCCLARDPSDDPKIVETWI
jgi:hypothetical protein